MKLGPRLLALLPALALLQTACARPGDCTQPDHSAPAVNCRWQTPTGTLQIEGKPQHSSLKLTALDRAGKILWAEERVEFIQRIHLYDGVLLVQTSNNGIGAYITLRTALLSPELERPVWVWGQPITDRPAQRMMLFTQESTGLPDDDARLEFQQVTIKPQVKVIPVSFAAPSRPNCGKAHGGWEAFGQPKFTQRYVYVVRQDECGYFMTRFDWVTPEAEPLSYGVPAPQ